MTKCDNSYLHRPTETAKSVLNTNNIATLLYYTIGTIAVCAALGIAWDIWRYFRRRKAKGISQISV